MYNGGMHNYKAILGLITLGIAFISYSDYFFSIFKRGTRPRTISWLIWGILNTIAFCVQYEKGAGYGSWITGFAAIMCVVIACVSYFKYDEHFTMYDWLPFTGAVISLLFWWYTSDALMAIVFASITNAIGFIPTIHNAYMHPNEETATTFGLNGLKVLISIFALGVFTITTWLYPLVIVILNIITVMIILIRREKKI